MPRVSLALVSMVVLGLAALRPAPAAAASCPDLPIGLSQLMAMGDSHALACYGHRTLALRVWVTPAPYGIGGIRQIEVRPQWLDFWRGSVVAVESGPSAGHLYFVWVPPTLGSCRLTPRGAKCPFRGLEGRWAVISGHFADPAARRCRIVYLAPDPTPGTPTTRAGAIAMCRRQFVLSAVGASPGMPPTAVPSPASGPESNGARWPAIIGLGLATAVLVARRGRARRRESSVHRPNGASSP